MKPTKVLLHLLAAIVSTVWVPSTFMSDQSRGTAVAADITINATTNLGSPSQFTGFMHGVTYDNSQDYSTATGLMSQLSPGTWRLASYNNVYGFVVTESQFPQNHGTLITLVVQDVFNAEYGDPVFVGPCDVPRANCFATFEDLRATWILFVDTLMREVLRNGLVVHYFDVFSEPESGWLGVSQPQLYELFKAAHDVIRQHEPEAKIVAPSTSRYAKNHLESFLTYVASNGLRLDALSWHEFGSPDELPLHVYQMRQFFASNSSLCNPTCPEIHINEYAGEQNHLIPGWTVGWLYFLERSAVDQAHRACWDLATGESTCWAGFNGVLMQDNVTPQHIYWAYKWHAGTLGATRLRADTTSSKVVALARKNDSDKSIHILVGKYDGAPESVKVQVRNYPYPYTRANVTVERVPTNSNLPSALTAPELLLNTSIPVINGSVTGTVQGFRNGEAYIITLRPGSM